jgi:hypothetical protein
LLWEGGFLCDLVLDYLALKEKQSVIFICKRNVLKQIYELRITRYRLAECRTDDTDAREGRWVVEDSARDLSLPWLPPRKRTAFYLFRNWSGML